MPIIGPIRDGIYAGRDAIELTGKVSRNAAAINLMHLGFGGAIGIGLVAAQARLLPRAASEDAQQGAAALTPTGRPKMDRLHAMRLSDPAIVTAAAAMVLITAGMQLGVHTLRTPLDRGITPMYFLGVGLFGGQQLFATPIREAYER